MHSKRAALVATLPVFLLLLVTLAVRFLPSLATTPDTPPPPASDTAPPQAPSLPADAATQTATEKVASAQLAAFQKGDYKAALAHASRGFQASGITPERFKSIIEAQYGPLTRGRPEFGPAWVSPNGMVSLPFNIKREQGGPFTFEYLLGKERGAWVIFSCHATRGAPIATGGTAAQKSP